jgi:hypothetical protein
MVELDCKADVLGVNYWFKHTRTDGSKKYGISVMLTDVSPAGSHKAMLWIEFWEDWNKSGTHQVIGPGGSKQYKDPGGTTWEIMVDKTTPAGSSSTAAIQICFEKVSPAEGKIVSIDVPAEAAEGDSVDLCATIKNVGGTTAKFFLRFYDGSTMVRETSPGNVAPGQTITDVCELFTMPGHAWTGKIDLIRQG